jgi:site-specific DNA-methyltransferase (adenine-specific)
VSKAIDKALGAKRPVIGTRQAHDIRGGNLMEASQGNGRGKVEYEYTAAATDEAKQWEGWGTALKPAYEPIVIARKPLAEKSVARQVMKTGTGGINIDAARVGAETMQRTRSIGGVASQNGSMAGHNTLREPAGEVEGRWPANLTHDGSDAAKDGFPADAGGGNGETRTAYGIGGKGTYGGGGKGAQVATFADSGSAARFFYQAKADQHDRIGSGHPTVKPLDLMQWLCRMLCPPGGLVLDLFGGTGSTGEAAFREGARAWLIERDPDYQADIARRMENATAGPVARRHAATRAKLARAAQAGNAAPASEEPIMGDMFGNEGGGRP